VKVGRNDPCPCGSGKKFKKCCGAGTDDGKFIPFPPRGAFAEDENGLPLTHMERLGTPNLATSVLKELQAAAHGWEFETQAELEAFVRAQTEEYGRRPLEDFLGISPDLMHRILSGRFGELGGFLSFGKGLAETDLESIPLLESAVILLRALVAGPLKGTEAGYLPRALVLDWWAKVGARREPNERLREIRKPNKEAAAWELLECRLQLEAAGLVVFDGSRFALTPEGRSLVESPDLDGLFQRLITTIGWKWDWNEIREGGRDFHPLCQRSFAFNLHLFDRLARDWVDDEAILRAYFRAFPALKDDFVQESRYGTMLRDLSITFGLTHWPRLLGLVEERGGVLEYDGKGELPPHEFRVTPLFGRLIKLRPE
jgi:hypothetical protein